MAIAILAQTYLRLFKQLHKMKDRVAKLRKLNDFRRSLPHVSARALDQIFKGIQEQGLPDLMTRDQMREATNELMTSVTPHGPLIVEIELNMIDGTVIHDLAVNPMAFLFHAYRKDGPFRAMLDGCIADGHGTADNPMRLAVYADEVVPGKELSHNNKRKQWCMYWSFCEFLAHFHLEETWMPILAIRSETVTKTAANISQVMAKALLLFFGDLPTDMRTGGCVLIGGDGTQVRIFIDLWMVLQDGGAHKLLWHCKGDGGTKMCMLCRDMIAEDTGEVDDDECPVIVCKDISAVLTDKCDDDDIRGSVDRLAARRLTLGIGNFKLLQQAVGFNDEPFGILRNDRLRDIVKPAKQYCHDWMHALMVSGVMNVVLWKLFVALSAVMGDIYTQVYNYIETWGWPAFRNHGTSVRDLFLRKREVSNKKAKTFKALASELLSLYPILALFLIRTVVRANICVAECEAFLALCDLVDLLTVANIGKCTPDQVHNAVVEFLQKCRDAGWIGSFIPKFHWLCHLASHLAEFGCLPTCWVHERKHRVAKRYATGITNTTQMEKSLLGEIVAHNLYDINRPGLFDLSPGLAQPSQATANIMQFVWDNVDPHAASADVRKSAKARIIPAGFVGRNDVALAKSNDGDKMIAGKIWMHIEVYGSALTVLERWHPTFYDRNIGYADWTRGGEALLVPTRDLLSSVCHCDIGGGNSRTIVPWLYRQFEPV